eukprot:CAMPEP_0171108756 /NCGR_PEP_ID=MMETSP0766_2-20121228/69540_1 /TAXON_ID=439317 /ORGANISM="Gambierdiscus australes, Strain CAWD 149" /LENGTH=117 /DNA_ID=CAMNT_0011570351 /DNA_START=30 /DNA_END=383 /DNA_ORIENTATION=+
MSRTSWQTNCFKAAKEPISRLTCSLIISASLWDDDWAVPKSISATLTASAIATSTLPLPLLSTPLEVHKSSPSKLSLLCCSLTVCISSKMHQIRVSGSALSSRTMQVPWQCPLFRVM